MSQGQKNIYIYLCTKSNPKLWINPKILKLKATPNTPLESRKFSRSWSRFHHRALKRFGHLKFLIATRGDRHFYKNFPTVKFLHFNNSLACHQGLQQLIAWLDNVSQVKLTPSSSVKLLLQFSRQQCSLWDISNLEQKHRLLMRHQLQKFLGNRLIF